MKIVYTDEARQDLEGIAECLFVNYPSIAPKVEARIRSVVNFISRWPESSRRLRDSSNIRSAPLGRYPYVIFYRIGDTVEILYIHHAARQPPEET
jgi:toxin ParE1/3/4